MSGKYYAPQYKYDEFNCIHCGVYAHQRWYPIKIQLNAQKHIDSEFIASYCQHCNQYTYWYREKMIVPSEAPVEPAHQDLPVDCLDEYNEAREIFTQSPRAAAALLRLCLQKLMPQLGQKGKNINDDIKALVSAGLPPLVQKALDFCRVIGNNAVHPGEINLNDTPEIAQQLFTMINYIVEDRISRPKEVQALYDQLPQAAREAIDQRDQKAAVPSGATPSE